MANTNTEFEIRAINHLALVCRDMAETVDFYSNVLGMKLTKTLDLPEGRGQHFFFDVGDGKNGLAFFWFPDAPEAAPKIASIDPEILLKGGDSRTAVASMNHVAFDVPQEKIDEYRKRLKAKGIPCTRVTGTPPKAGTDPQTKGEPDETKSIRSVYFLDPNGILLEFACWVRKPTAADVTHKPATAADAAKYLAQATATHN